MQSTILLISLLGMLFVTGAFVYAIKHSASREDDYSSITRRAYSLRRWAMVFICALGIVVAFTTLAPFPITALAGSNPRVIKAESGQWYWKLENTTATVGEPVQYHVTTADVNHGFAVFDPDNRLIGQTQAMPGYTNKLNLTYTQPGVHIVRCLEYCGLAHHAMIVEINVSEAN